MKKYLLLLLIPLFFLFFYKLSDAPLQSFDEAWYAEIARNIVETKNPLKLIFNGRVFTDHPPLGYILMSIPTIILGSNEFSVRVVSVLLGILSIVLVYLIGSKMNSKFTGISASLVLLSSMWFMFRARSGNLDIPFLFFELLTVYLLMHKKKKFLYLGIASLAATFLIKTLVGFGLIPVVIYLIYINHKKYKLNVYLKALFLFLTILLPWYLYNQYLDSEFLYHHFFEVGARSESNAFSFEAIKNSLFYLSIGIGKWYKVFLVSIPLFFINYITYKKNRLNLTILLLLAGGFSIFLVSSRTEIWHLIPLYPLVALSIGLIPQLIISIPKLNHKIIKFLFLSLVALIAGYQYTQFSNLIYTNLNGYSDVKDISIKAGKFDDIYLSETFMPATVYYSNKNIQLLFWNKEPYQDLKALLQTNPKSVFIINKDRQDLLKQDQVNFTILDQNDSYSIVRKSS